VRLAALNLRGISGGGSGGIGAESVIQRISGFSPKFTSSHFSLNVTFLCKLRRIRVLRCALEFRNVANSVFGTPFCVIKLL